MNVDADADEILDYSEQILKKYMQGASNESMSNQLNKAHVTLRKLNQTEGSDEDIGDTQYGQIN